VALWWRRGRLVRRDALPLVPWLAAGAGAGLFTAWVERRYIGAQGPEFDLSILQRFEVAGRALWFYLGKLLWPSGFVFVYPRWDMNAQGIRIFLFPLGALGLLGAAWLLYRSRRTFRGPLAAALFFVGSLFPVLGFLNVYPFLFSYVADHFQYIASLGIFALLAGGADLLWRRLAAQARPILAAAAAGVLAILGLMTWRLCHDYRDAETLYRATLARNPGAWLAEINLGSVLMEKGRLGEAEPHYRAAEREEPDYHATHFDLGKLLVQEGRATEAIPELNEALRLSPGDSEARDNLGIALAETGRQGEAEAQFRQAIRLQPGNPKAYYNLGVALQNEGRLEEAARSYEESIRLRPDFPEARRALDQLRALPGGTGAGELGR
jgi:tetratricopeptide (TPR) repeat protein